MRLIIIGAGFAGMYAALSAAPLARHPGVSPEELEIAVLVAPEPTLVVRPRLYEPKPKPLTATSAGCPSRPSMSSTCKAAPRPSTPNPRGASHDRQGYAKDALLRPSGRGHGRPAVPSEYSGASPSTASVSTSLDDAVAPRQASAQPSRPAGRGRTRHGRRCRRRYSPASRAATENTLATPCDSSQESHRAAASSSSTANSAIAPR